MRQKCVLCHKIHDHTNWRYAPYVTVDCTEYGWFCSKWFKPTQTEKVPQRVKDSRNEYAKSMLQPYRDGVLSQEFVDTYGTKHVNPKDVRKAKPVWKDTLPSNWKRSK